MIFALLACTGTSDDTGVTVPFDGNFVFTDANNYNYTSSIDGTTTEVGLRADFTVDWSGLDTDLMGHAMDAGADVDLVWFLQFPNLTEAEVEQRIVEDALLAEDLGVYVQFDNDADVTSASLSQFVFPPDTMIDPATDFTDGSGTWMMRVTTGLLNSRMIQFVRPTEESTNHALSFTPSSAVLNFDADLQSLDDFAITDTFPTYTADWTNLTQHAGGIPYDAGRIDQLMVARYDGLSLSDIEDDFIDVELIAADIYTADVYGLDSADLSMAVSATSGAFAGFGANTLWLIALRCTTCNNPAPPFLTVVQVGE